MLRGDAAETDDEDDNARDKNADTYSNYDVLLRITDWAAKLSWVFLGAGILLVLYGSLVVLPIVVDFSYFFDGRGFEPLALARLLGLFVPLLVGIVCLFLSMMSRAIEQGLFLLMDIEENTWQGTKKLAAPEASDSTPAS